MPSVAPAVGDVQRTLVAANAGRKPPSIPGIDACRSVDFGAAPRWQHGFQTLNSPCAIGTACTQIPVTASVCSDNGGIWYDQTNTDGTPKYPSCCSVNLDAATLGITPYKLQPLTSVAVRNDHYKLVRNGFIDDMMTPGICSPDEAKEEFYRINEKAPYPLIDRDVSNLLDRRHRLTAEEASNLRALRQQLREILESQPPCPADGNSDGVVNAQDLDNARNFAALPPQTNGYNSSWYDVNLDGLTDWKDLAVITVQQHPPTTCR